MSETTTEKAKRILEGGGVVLDHAKQSAEDPEPILVFRVSGDHGTYFVESGEYGVDCRCPAYKKSCSHATAVRLFENDIRSATRANVINERKENR